MPDAATEAAAPDSGPAFKCSSNAAWCEQFDDGTWRDRWNRSPSNAIIVEDQLNFTSAPSSLAFETTGLLSSISRQVANLSHNFITLSASLQINQGNGEIDLMSVHGSPSGIIVMADATRFALQVPDPAGTRNVTKPLAFPIDFFTRVTLTIDRTTHEATLDSGAEKVSLTFDSTWTPSEVRFGFFYTKNITTPWRMRVDDVELDSRP